jgi:ATP-dependent RNA helicase DHX33
MIAVTQPRRVAATTLARRVAAERGVILGTGVGYSVRFDEVFCAQTRIKYVTDGMIVRELLSDSLLSRYGVVIVDEAHERTLRTDMLISSLKTIQRLRNGDGKSKLSTPSHSPLKIVIMSATLDAEKFSKFYDGCVFFIAITRMIICLIWP